jgi:hypothetical protein
LTVDPSRVTNRISALAAALFLLVARVAAAQPVETPAPTPSPAVPLPAAGAIPANLFLDVTGFPAADADVLDAQIRAALERAIRPTLRPGSSLRFGPIVPWPLFPLAAGSRAAVNVTSTIMGDGASAPVSGVTTVTLNSVAVPRIPPSVLFLSDDPEYLQTEGLVFRGSVPLNAAARLYYYHSDIGLPRNLDVVLTATVPSRVHLIASQAGPDLDVMSAGHTVSRDLLRFEGANEGIVADVAPGKPFVVRHALLLQAEVVAGALDAHVLSGGAVGVSVVAAPAGSRPDVFLAGPRVPFDGHRRHGAFDLTTFGALAARYSAGGPDVAVQYGGKAPTPRNLDPADTGRDYGDYGVVHTITFTLLNPTDTPAMAYLYEKPLGGPVRSTFVVDGQLKEIGCVRLSQPYWVATYQLPAQSSGMSTTVTMTDGGSWYPLEYGVSQTPPQPYTPPVGSPDGCSPNAPPFADPTPAPRP